MHGRRETISLWGIAVLALVAGLSIVPTPYYLLAPGSAVELAERIAVRGHPAPERRYYLTDVTLARASVLLLAGKFFPGTRIVRRETVVPPGVSAKSYDRVLVDAMDDSQNIAAIVAERAAGYRVATPPRRFVVAEIPRNSHAIGVLRPGDRVVRVAGRDIVELDDITQTLRALGHEPRVVVDIEREGVPRRVTIVRDTTPRLGVLIRERSLAARLPVPVRFTIGDIAGSSGGLMFALEIFAALEGTHRGEAVAGTGTMALDGSIGRIEGTQQKVIAAERAGARVFLVPMANYAEIAGERGIRIVPVRRFADALRAIGMPAPKAEKFG